LREGLRGEVGDRVVLLPFFSTSFARLVDQRPQFLVRPAEPSRSKPSVFNEPNSEASAASSHSANSAVRFSVMARAVAVESETSTSHDVALGPSERLHRGVPAVAADDPPVALADDQRFDLPEAP